VENEAKLMQNKGVEPVVSATDLNHSAADGDGNDMATPIGKRTTSSPAFQFYPESWFSSSKVQRMSRTERGIYIDLLAYCWLENGLPTDVRKLAELVGQKPDRFGRMWANGPLNECFFERNGRLFNPRQERERKKQRQFSEQKRAAALAGWNRRHADALQDDADCIAPAMPSVSDPISDPVSISKKKKEESDDTSPTVLTFPVTGNQARPTWALTEARIAGWTAAYPHVNVLGECRKALVWVEANGPKTAKGMPAFLVRWLNTAVNRGPRALPATGTEGRGRTGAPPQGKYDGIEERD
jgi:uncharacterized protein YdaU (DUF1376 family)